MNEPIRIQWESNSLPIFQPRFVDSERTKIKALVRLPDGRYVEMEGKRGDAKSTFVRDVLSQYTESQIDAFTAHERALLEVRSKVEAQATEDRTVVEEREIAFQAKAKALALPEVIHCPDKRVARKIRRAKSAFEVGGWLAVAFLKALDAEAAEEAAGEAAE